MNKILSRIAIAIASFAMVLGGASTISRQANPTYADTGDVVATFNCNNVVGYPSKEYENTIWKVSHGKDNRCGFDSREWQTIEEQGYTKYIDGTEVTPSTYGWVVATKNSLSFVGSFDFNYTYGINAYLYLTYSVDGENYSLVPLTEGVQGTEVSKNNTQSFDFNSIRSAYYAIIVVRKETVPPSNLVFLLYDVLCHFYEKIDPLAERISIIGSNSTYVNEEIELTATTYNYSPGEYTWTSSDTSIVTVSSDGNRATIHGVSKGTVYITVSTEGTNGIVYTDPFAITVKKFDFKNINTSSVALSIHENKIIDGINYQDSNGNVVLEAISANTNAVTVRTPRNSCAIITASNIGGISTTVTLIAKDNGGAEGCHIVTRTIQVTVYAHRFLGEMVTATNECIAYVATMDRNHYLAAIDDGYYGFELTVTDNLEEAILFNYFSGDFGFIDFYGEPKYLCCDDLNSISLDDSPDWFGFLQSEDKYNGALCLGGNYFIYYTIDDMGEVCLEYESIYEMDWYDEEGIISLSNVFCAYYAVESDPNITPNEASVELTENESADITATVESVNSATYEILSGSQCIEEVIVSDIDDLNQFNIHIEASSDYYGAAVIRIKDANDDNVYTDITVVVKSAAKLRINNISTQAKLSYSYVVQDKMSYDISDVAIRFGGMIEKDEWDELNTNFGIEAFGVMLSDANLIEQRVDEKIANEGSFDDAVLDDKTYSMVKDTDIKVFYDYLSSGREPAEQGNYYFWNLYKMVNATEIGFKRQYTATAFILTSDGDVVFFDEITTSAAKLADELATNDNVVEATDGSICYIASFNEED